MTDNWTENKNKTLYQHKVNSWMIVAIMESHDPKNAKYFVYHTHPGYGGIVIPQKMERATSMEHARRLAEVHMKHWNDATKWKTDPDFGKAN
jgi:hypothetical protein